MVYHVIVQHASVRLRLAHFTQQFAIDQPVARVESRCQRHVMGDNDHGPVEPLQKRDNPLYRRRVEI
jgi:hypothetical protein